MKERPIIFTAESVQGILRGRKTQTRRLMKEPWWRIRLLGSVRADFPFGRTLSFGGRRAAPAGIYDAHHNPFGAVSVVDDNGELLGVKPHEFEWVCPYGKPGERLWVRETWLQMVRRHWPPPYAYKADQTPDGEEARQAYIRAGYPYQWCSPMRMPKIASRIMLEVDSVSVERLQSISDDDICRELGAPLKWEGEGPEPYVRNLRQCMEFQWDRINGKRAPWADNPWVWAIGFKVVEVLK